MKDTINRYIKKLTNSLRRSALLNVAPSQKATSRLDLSRFSVLEVTPSQIISRVLFEEPYELTLNFDSRRLTDERKIIRLESLYAALRAGVEKTASFVVRETGLRSLWLLYPIVYLRSESAQGRVNDVLAPVYLWPITLSTVGQRYREVKISRDSDASEPVFNTALSLWVLDQMGVGVDDEKTRDLWGADYSSLEDRIRDVFSPLSLATPSLGKQLDKLPKKPELRKGSTQTLFDAAVIGILQWQNQELMKDLELIAKIAHEKPKSLERNLICDFLQGKSLHSVSGELPPPSEKDRYLVHESDFSQEKAVWKARARPGTVIDGPPGTGKSQTIANIVVDALAHEQKILILCQKRAALDVVASRLNEAGLGDYYLLIHDAKADRMRAIGHMKSTMNNTAQSGGTAALDRFQHLSDQITGTEKLLDAYHRDLVTKNDQVGQSYQQVIANISRLHDKNPNLRPVPELKDLLKNFNYEALMAMKLAVSTAATYWQSGKPLTNPWSNLKEDLHLGRYEMTAITDVLTRSAKLNEEHIAFVNGRGCGSSIDGQVATFISDGRAQLELIEGQLPIGKLLEHLIAWGRLGKTGIPEETGETRRLLREALSLVSRLRANPVDQGLDEKLGDLSREDIDSLLSTISEIQYYEGKWWRRFSGRYSGMRAKLNRPLRQLGLPFSFNLLNMLADHLKAKLVLFGLQDILQKVFRDESETLLPLSTEELSSVLHEKIKSLLVLRKLREVKDTYSWAATVWAGISGGRAQDLKKGIDSLSVAVERAVAFQEFFNQLSQLKKWLSDSFVEKLEGSARQGESVGSEISVLRQYLPVIESILSLRTHKLAMKDNEKKIVTLLEDFHAKEESGKTPSKSVFHPSHWWELCLVAAYSTWEEKIHSGSDSLKRFDPQWYETTKTQLKELLDRKRKRVVPAIRQILFAKRKEAAANVGWRTLLALRGRGANRLRQIVEMGSPMGLFRLVPCWMMTPNMASRLFPLKEGYFNIVVFDEASQCPIEQAIPAIYRSGLVVVSGDEKQLPPTSFFHSSTDWPEVEFDNEAKLYEKGDIDDEKAMEQALVKLGKQFAEGVTDLLEASKGLLPRQMLQVHYRSRYPELIEFSNYAFYKGKLEAPPTAGPRSAGDLPPIKFYHLSDSPYGDKVNETEAEKVVSIVADIMKADGKTPTLGIVTFNQPQAAMIEKKLDAQAEKDDEFRALYEKERQRREGEQDVGLFIKNLENVQGDEREVMLFSTTFGRDDHGKFKKFFGPLNFDGGERRLNVAISRAQYKKIIITSMPINEISPRVFHDALAPGERYSGRDFLQLYIRYAQAVDGGHREEALAMCERALKIGHEEEDPNNGGDESESPFEEEVYEKLTLGLRKSGIEGVEVDKQVGHLGFRIDLAVRRIDYGSYVLGIECDGRTYHETDCARVRDIWRQGILEDHGWTIHRIWSPNWWRQPEVEIDKVLEKLKGLMAVT